MWSGRCEVYRVPHKVIFLRGLGVGVFALSAFLCSLTLQLHGV